MTFLRLLTLFPAFGIGFGSSIPLHASIQRLTRTIRWD